MNRYLIATILFAIFSVFSAAAQKKTKDEQASAETKSEPADKTYQFEENVALRALRYNDANVAKFAIYRMIEMRPERVGLMDTLASVYFSSRQFVECVLVCRDILQRDPSNLGALEMKAISQQGLGLLKDALDDYEKLYSASKQVEHLYQIASLQYELKRVAECSSSIDRIVAEKGIEDKKVTMYVSERESQEVPLRAAAQNMKGVLAMELGEFDSAKRFFEDAIKTFPEFELAKNNMKAVENEKKKTEGTKAPVKK